MSVGGEDAARLFRAGRLREAAEAYARILKADPQNFDALHALAAVYFQQGEFEPAENLLARALALRPDSAEILYNRGSLLQKLGRKDEALICFDAALSVRADYPEALGNRGAVLMELGRYDEAFADYSILTIARPSWPQAWSNQGAALMKLTRYREALASYSKAITVKPDSIEARRARAWLAFSLRQFAEALADIAWILARDPSDAVAWQLRGDVLAAAGRNEAAVESYGRAIALRPDGADCLFNRANNLFGLRRFEHAVRDYAAVVRLHPEYRYALGHLVFAKLCCCDWPALDGLRDELRTGVQTGRLAVQPFHALVALDSEEAIFRATRDFAAAEFPGNAERRPHRAAHTCERIRVGYVSAGFHNHAVSRLIAGVFEHHDRSRFEVTAFSLGPDDGGSMRRRLIPAFHEFVDVSSWDDQRVADEIRHREADIVFDLMGFTENSRPGILAQRPAPIQINYLAYPGTMAVDHIDYLIADGTVIPPGSEAHFSEKIIRLPHCYLPQDLLRAVASPVSRTDAGLPQRGFVFCCFNHSYKIIPGIFDVWMNLLRRVRGSVLWLNQLDFAAQRNLVAQAKSRGIEAERIIFAPFVADDFGHLARLQLADLFLDTPLYNAHATASDALWVGVPVLTIRGETFPARVGASLLHSLDMDELISPDLGSYEENALVLAREPARLQGIRSKLAANSGTGHLFNTAEFTRHFESALETVALRFWQGLPPQSFDVRETP